MATHQRTDRISQEHVMVSPGMFETRTIYGVKEHKPNRYAEAGYPECDDWTGWIHLDGKRVAVETGYWGGALVWQIARD